MIYERHVSKSIEMRHYLSALKKWSIRIKWILMEILAKNYDKFVVLTNGNKNEWKSLQNMEVIANPLSFYPKESSSTQNRKVIAVGKQSYQKGYDLLLEAWQEVVKKLHGWQLNIYGKFDESQQLEQKANELNIAKNVNFYPPEKNIQSKYLESSIYVMSSRFEGFGMVLIEAMACGVPCVSFDCPHGPADIINDGEDGFVVENGNIKALANKIILLIEDMELRKKMGANAKKNIKRYLPGNIVPQWDKLFRTLLKNNYAQHTSANG